VPAAAPAPVPTPTTVGAPQPAPVAAPRPAATERATQPSAEVEQRKAKARQWLNRGKAALDNQDYDTAARYFQSAKELDPDLVEADQLLKHTSQLVSLKTTGQVGILSRLQRRNLIAKEAAMVEINKAMKQAADGLAASQQGADFDKAEQSARLARDRLDADKSFFTAMEYRNELARIENELGRIAVRREAFNKAKIAAEAQEIERIQAQRRLEEQRKLLRKIDALTQQAKDLRSQQKYDKALEVADQILLFDPKNAWAKREREYLVEFDILMKSRATMRDQRVEEAKALWDTRRSEVPWYEYLRYPENWKQLSEERKEFQASAAGESAMDAALREKLKREIERLSFADIDFKDVIQFLREYSDANIHVNWRALSAAGIEQTTKVTVDVRKISVKRALDLVLADVSGAAAGADAELRYVLDEGVLIVSTKADLARVPIRRVYDIRDLLVPVPDFQGPRIELQEATQQSYNTTGGGGGGTGGIFQDEESLRREREEEEITKEKLTEEFIKLVRNAIDRESWGDPEGGGGAGAGFIKVLNGQLVVTQTAENHQALSELIEKLREARTIQIMIEARFIVVDSGFLNSVGVDLDFYFNLGTNMNRADGGVVTDPWTGATVPTYTDQTGNVISSVPVLGMSPWYGNRPDDQKWSPIGLKSGSAAFMSGIQTLVGSNIGLAVDDNGPALSVGGTFLDDIQVDFLIQATQAHVSTRQLTAPKITLSNGQRAYITVARQQAYIREYIPVVSGNATAYRPVVDYIPTGAVLDVAATATADRRYVMMTVRPQVSNQEGDPLAVLTDGGIIQLPTVSVQDLQTTVTVPDGGTLLLGGQRLAGETDREMGAPVLNKIPIINRMFSNRATVRDERTLLILVKPKIMINEQAERNEKLYVEAPRLP
jgi:general secretion pathway protein D